MNTKLLLTLFSLILIFNNSVKAQFNLEGDFQIRWYTDSFYDTRDERGKENYMRYLSRLMGTVRAGKNITFNTQISTIIQNEIVNARNIAGTGQMRYAISQLYAELSESNFLIFDIVRLRAGRQAFGLGSGLTWGESYYYLDKFDGARLDLAYEDYALTLFGAITGQNLSESGLYPEPGSDQVYAVRLSTDVFDQSVMGYFTLNRPRGSFNDNRIIGGGISGSFYKDRIEYFGEFAHQQFNQPIGFPDKGGIGYIAGLSYRFPFWIFRSIKVETKYAAFQGNDKSTPEQEIFSPPYASFFWGDRFGYVNGEIGGNFPNRGRYPDGSRLWYSRIYFIPKDIPDLRIQFQYIKMNEFIDNDNYNVFDDEFSIRLYYRLFRQTQVQLRYTTSFPNGEDKDLNDSGTISSTEDRYSYSRFMMELRIVF